MKRRSKFILAFITATLTFGSLMAFVGPQKSGWHPRKHYCEMYDANSNHNNL